MALTVTFSRNCSSNLQETAPSLISWVFLSWAHTVHLGFFLVCLFKTNIPSFLLLLDSVSEVGAELGSSNPWRVPWCASSQPVSTVPHRPMNNPLQIPRQHPGLYTFFRKPVVFLYWLLVTHASFWDTYTSSLIHFPHVINHQGFTVAPKHSSPWFLPVCFLHHCVNSGLIISCQISSRTSRLVS